MVMWKSLKAMHLHDVLDFSAGSGHTRVMLPWWYSAMFSAPFHVLMKDRA
jgi:hypothetical protein